MVEARVAVALAILLFPLLIGVQVVLVHAVSSRRPTWQLIALYLGIAAYLIGWAYGWTRLCPDRNAYGLAAGLASAGFLILGYLQVHALLDRGITLQCLMELYRRGEPLTPHALAQAYSGNRGMDWMFEKRIRHMRLMQVITVDDERVALKSPLGPFCARVGLLAKSVLRLGSGG